MAGSFLGSMFSLSLAASASCRNGDNVGAYDGSGVGLPASYVGDSVGLMVGLEEGDKVGLLVGSVVGAAVGLAVGSELGEADGLVVGCADGD